LKTTLNCAGLGFEHVARMTSYIKSYDPEFMATFRAVRLRYFDPTRPPASVMVQAGLYDERLLVESEVIAIAPQAEEQSA
jgi:2-iminobutanoate/2-iminopropanoate deaminase